MPHNKFHLIIFFIYNLLMVLHCNNVEASNTDSSKVPQNGISACYQLNYGFILPHRPVMEILSDKHFTIHEISLIKKTSGKNRWERIYKYPYTGVTYLYSNQGNNNYLGPVHILMYNCDIPLTSGKKLKLLFRNSWGLSWSEKIYHRVNNYKNIAIGSKINVAARFGCNLNYQLIDNFDITSGISLQHYSNGAFQQPNLGVNIASAYLGINYRIIPVIRSSLADTGTHIPSFNYIVTGGFSLKEIYPAGRNKFLAISLGADMLRNQSWKFRYGGGVDLFYDPSILTYLSRGSKKDYGPQYAYRLGIHLTAELLVNRFSFPFNFGYYIYAPEKTEGSMYHKFGTRCMITKHLFLHVLLKTHFFKADLIEFGTGLIF